MFRIGFKIGLKPEELLDLSLLQFNACVLGYEDRRKLEELQAIKSGYWCSYYMNGKNPKSVDYWSKKIFQETRKKPDVDVNKFKQMEAKFKENQEWIARRKTVIST